VIAFYVDVGTFLRSLDNRIVDSVERATMQDLLDRADAGPPALFFESSKTDHSEKAETSSVGGVEESGIVVGEDQEMAVSAEKRDWKDDRASVVVFGHLLYECFEPFIEVQAMIDKADLYFKG
jgi:hypothetical protein